MYKVIALVLSLTLGSCTKHDLSEEEKLSLLTGTWQLVEQKIGIGPPGTWQPVDDGATYQLNSDNTFSASEHSDCTSGYFTISDNRLQLIFDCPAYHQEWNYKYNVDSKYLLLSPADRICTEGCEYKYERL